MTLINWLRKGNFTFLENNDNLTVGLRVRKNESMTEYQSMIVTIAFLMEARIMKNSFPRKTLRLHRFMWQKPIPDIKMYFHIDINKC